MKNTKKSIQNKYFDKMVKNLFKYDDKSFKTNDDAYEQGFYDGIACVLNKQKEKHHSTPIKQNKYSKLFNDEDFQKELVEFLKDNLDITITSVVADDPRYAITLCGKTIKSW